MKFRVAITYDQSPIDFSTFGGDRVSDYREYGKTALYCFSCFTESLPDNTEVWDFPEIDFSYTKLVAIPGVKRVSILGSYFL